MQSQIADRLRARQGNRPSRQFAKELGMSAVYLSHIYNRKREPGPAVLAKLGIQREIVYRAE